MFTIVHNKLLKIYAMKYSNIEAIPIKNQIQKIFKNKIRTTRVFINRITESVFEHEFQKNIRKYN